MRPLSTFELASDVTYGPVRSRRLGVSLGMNILPAGTKTCSFNCGYCQCGFSKLALPGADAAWPAVERIASGLQARLSTARTAGERLDCLTLAGNGEPTMHPEFDRIVRAILEVRDRAWPGLPVRVLSNSAHLANDRVVAALDLLDERIMKLDAGNDRLLHAIDSPLVPLTIEDLVHGLRRLRDCVIQSFFVCGGRNNTTGEAVSEWIDAVARVRPLSVQIATIARRPADARLEPAPAMLLRTIRDLLARRTGIQSRVFAPDDDGD